MKNIIICFSLSGSLALLMAGCQKEESVQPASESNDYSDQKQILLPEAVFESISIDHYAGTSLLPDYSVKVSADGQGVYEGNRNVAVIGKVRFDVSEATLKSLKEMFSHSNFFRMRDEIIFAPDLPVNTTAYASKGGADFTKTLHDRDAKPAELASLRNKVEDLLHISKYVLKTGPRLVGAAAIAVD
ncbi:MAG: DUF6438 domain-containing protein [Bacteroidota bacterium]